MKDAAQLFGAPSPEAHKFAVDIFNFEKRIAEITPDLDYLTDPIKVNNKVKVGIFITFKFLIGHIDQIRTKVFYRNVN
jgi:hypothetical protein